MMMELTLQLPVISWTPKLAIKPAPVKQVKLEEMSLSELLFVAVGSAL